MAPLMEEEGGASLPAVRNEMGACNSMTHMTLTLEFSDADIDSPQPVTFDVVTTVLKALLFWDIYIGYLSPTASQMCLRQTS